MRGDVSGQQQKMPDIPPITGTVFFLYYDDVRAAIRWYEEKLRFRNVYDDDWVAILEIMPGAFIGLVNATEGTQHPVPGHNKGALVAIETKDLRGWRDQLAAIEVPIFRDIHKGAKGKTDTFHVLDPGGYIVEFYKWL